MCWTIRKFKIKSPCNYQKQAILKCIYTDWVKCLVYKEKVAKMTTLQNVASEMMANQKENQSKFIVFLLVNMIKSWPWKNKSCLSEVYLRPKVGSLHKAQGINHIFVEESLIIQLKVLNNPLFLLWIVKM